MLFLALYITVQRGANTRSTLSQHLDHALPSVRLCVYILISCIHILWFLVFVFVRVHRVVHICTIHYEQHSHKCMCVCLCTVQYVYLILFIQSIIL